jgi:membrane protein required for colicin V production
MSVFDIALLVILLVFVWKGFRAGLVGAIGGFVGIIIAIWAGSHYMQQVAQWIMNAINIDNEPLANILAFVAIFIAINVVVSIIVSIINKIFHIIPFIDLTNKLLGAVVGLVGGALAVSAIVYLMSLFPISDSISDMMIKSELADWAVKVAVVVKPFIPAAIKGLRSIL